MGNDTVMRILLVLLCIFVNGCFIDGLYSTNDDDPVVTQHKAPEPNPPVAPAG
jgi:hypothetical protein